MGMGVRLSGEFLALDDATIAKIPGTLGVFELTDRDGVVVYIGMAGARTLFGLRSAISEAAAAWSSEAVGFRYEENMQYTSRYDELLMVHIADHGDVPACNRREQQNDPSGSRRVGRLSPG